MYQTTLEQVNIATINHSQEHWYAWNNATSAIKHSQAGTYTCYEVLNLEQEKIGFFVINAASGYLPQFELYKTDLSGNWDLLFDGIAQISRVLKINNIDAKRTEQRAILVRLGLENTINQYEMERKI